MDLREQSIRDYYYQGLNIQEMQQLQSAQNNDYISVRQIKRILN